MYLKFTANFFVRYFSDQMIRWFFSKHPTEFLVLSFKLDYMITQEQGDIWFLN